jgi:type I restriction enzyme, S subunit
MNHAWRMVPLGEVLIQYQEYIEAPEPRLYPKLSVKLYGKGVVLDEPADGSMLKMKRHQIAKAGQVILSEIWGKKGAVGIVPPEGGGALCTSHFFLFDIRRDCIEPKYLQAIFTANYLQEQLSTDAKGTTGYAAVRPKTLLKATIPLPPLSEQQRIVARIEELAARIEEARGLRQQAVTEAEALQASGSNALFDSARCDGWPTVALGDVSDIRSGVTLGRTLRGPTIRLPYLRVANVQDGHLDLRVIKEVEILAEEVDKWQLQPGDILLTEGGDWDKLGRGTVWSGEIPNCIHQNHIFRVRVDAREFDPRFLAAVIGSPYGKRYFQAAAKQTTNLATINQRQLKAFTVIRPSLAEQRRIVTYLDDIQRKVNNVRQLQAKTATELDALLPSVLDKAFKGEL